MDRASFLPHFTAFHRRNFCFFADGASVERRALVRVVFRSVVKFVMICATGRAPTHRYLSSIRSWKVQFTDKLGGAMIYVWKLDKLIFPAWVSNICIKPWIGLQMFINCVCHNSVKSGSGGPGGRLLACLPAWEEHDWHENRRGARLRQGTPKQDGLTSTYALTRNISLSTSPLRQQPETKIKCHAVSCRVQRNKCKNDLQIAPNVLRYHRDKRHYKVTREMEKAIINSKPPETEVQKLLITFAKLKKLLPKSITQKW